MSGLRTRLLRPRVYSTALLALAVVAVAWWAVRAAPARGQVDVTIDPAMVKGAPRAVVTIFEFSDYQ